MGSFKKAFSSVVKIGSLGLLDVAGTDKAKVDTSQSSSELAKEQEDVLKKRKALFATEGGILGEEAQSVLSSKRGNILGN